MGNKHWEDGNYKKAILEYKKAISIDPDYDIAYYNIGFVFGQLDQYDSAIVYPDRSIEINP